AALDEHGFGAGLRRKAPLLLGDLRALGDHVPPAWCAVLPDTSSLARRLGIAYVLEGSTLGGRYILANMPAALADVPTAFLQGYGPATGASWKAYAAIAERLLASRDALEDAIAGARDTFECLIDWLARHARVEAAS
ncbi:MAG TPA: biliverdin-producing heme oxygenase, partial [Kofleriaceae bacterium]|nr:biliverdin-producing heme oxygenase [Kofleriaceae bacterium]